MRSLQRADGNPVRLGVYKCLLLGVWTAFVGVHVAWDLYNQHRETSEVARIQARFALATDQVFRRWAAMHGGVYVEATPQTPPSPGLVNVEDRDIVTPSGRSLTLMTPAYMVRQLHELGAEQFGLIGHITSLKPIRHQNGPDPWEASALRAFEQGSPEVSSISEINGKPFLRLMRPMPVEADCLLCHAQQGYKVGDVRGGVSVSVPLEPLFVIAGMHTRTLVVGNVVLWLLGLGGILLLTGHLEHRIAEREEAEAALKKHVVALEVAKAELQTTNEALDEKNAQLAELNDIAYEFVDNAAHDFRTPLSVIKEFASIIADGLAGDVTASQREYLGIIGNCVEDLVRLVQDMLDVSKSEAGLLRMRRSISTVDKIVDRIRAGLESRAEGGVNLIIDLDPNLPEIYCDAAQIGRVITNLAINAVKFVGEGGHVTIWSKLDENSSQVVVGITDDGPGIDPDRLQHIFERFTQVGTNARASAKGVGLGLSIAKELVSLNFGQIAVESTPGKGSTFSFTLPTADPVRLLQRCLDQSSPREAALRHVSLMTVQAEPEPSNDVIVEVDQLLNDMLRCMDLILPVGPAKWLLVLRAAEDQCKSIARRIETSRNEANRNRPTGLLPRLVLDYRGTWLTVTEQDELLASFHEAMRTAETARV